MTEIREMNATRCLSLVVVMVGMLIGSGRASEAGLITYTLSGGEGVGTLSQFGEFFPTGAFDPVSLTMTVDTSTIVNDPALSNFSPGYITGSALATITVSDPTYGNLSATAMAHAVVFQTGTDPNHDHGYFTAIQFIADSGPSLGSVIGQIYLPEPSNSGLPLPVTYDLKSPLGPASGVAIVSYPFQTPGVTFFIGGLVEGEPAFPFSNVEFQATAVPEPSSLVLCGIAGLLVVGACRRRHG